MIATDGLNAYTPAARLLDLGGTLFLTVSDPSGRIITAPLQPADLLAPESAARRLEEVSGVGVALPPAAAWPTFLAFAWARGGRIE